MITSTCVSPIDDSTIFYRVHKDSIAATGPAVILLHGFMGTGEIWERIPLIPMLLNEGFCVICPDVRGHGASSKPHDKAFYSERHLAADCIAVLDALDINKAHFFGYSMGAQVCFGVAKEYPDRILSILLGGISPNAYKQETIDWLLGFYGSLSTGDIEGFADKLITMTDPVLCAEDKKLLTRHDLVTNDAVALYAKLTASFETSFDTTDNALNKQPCYIFCGDEDAPAFADLQAYMERRTAAVDTTSSEPPPACEFVSIPKYGHLNGFRQVDTFAPPAVAFMKSISS